LLNETKLLIIAKLANMLVDLFGLKKIFQKIGESACFTEFLAPE